MFFPSYSSLTYPASSFSFKKTNNKTAPPQPKRKKAYKKHGLIYIGNYFEHRPCPGVWLIYPV